MNTGEQRTGPSYERLLLICCSATFVCYCGSYMRIPVVPLYAKLLGANTVDVGVINSTFLLVAGLFSLPLGLVSDRVGRKLLILCGLLTIGGTSLLLSLASSARQIALIYFLFGVGVASFGPTMMSFVADFSPSTHLGRSYGWYTLAIYGGMSLGPAAGGGIAQLLGYKPVFIFAGVLLLVLAVIVFFILPRARHVLVNRPPRRPAIDIMRGLLRNPSVLTCWLVTIGGFMGFGMFITFIPLYGQNRGLHIGQIGIVFAAQAVSNALSRIPFGRLSDYVSHRSNLVTAGFICYAAALAGFGFAVNLAWFVLFAVVTGAGMGLAFTAVGALIAEVVEPGSRGIAMGGYNSSIYFGMMLGALVMGAVIRSIGYPHAFFIIAGINLAVTAVFTLVFNFTRARARSEAPV
ncbi:MAG: MFS transporter [Deltaproteobacteria bacterium]|nr:MFS transporter [Deltaproteobacteria bacterium]